jgi:hypothetical protein
MLSVIYDIIKIHVLYLVVPGSHLSHDQTKGRFTYIRFGQDCPYRCQGNFSVLHSDLSILSGALSILPMRPLVTFPTCTLC